MTQTKEGDDFMLITFKVRSIQELKALYEFHDELKKRLVNLNKMKSTSVDVLDISSRTKNIFKYENIRTLLDVYEKFSYLKEVPNFGKVCEKELRHAMSKQGIEVELKYF